MPPTSSPPPPPIRPHPNNTRYFEYAGRALALITSTEHFGAVINNDFDYRKYLATVAAHGFTLTQTWTGIYVEPDSDVGPHNPLDPKSGRYIAPWTRSATDSMEPPCRNSYCGKKFDLTRPTNKAFFSRLTDFVDTAALHGIIVEVGLFGGYEQTHESIWQVLPFHPGNNINVPHGSVNRTTVYSLAAPKVLRDAQIEFVKAIAAALLSRSNVYYQLVNLGDHAEVAWGQLMLNALREVDATKMVAVPHTWAAAAAADQSSSSSSSSSSSRGGGGGGGSVSGTGRSFVGADLINFGQTASPSDARRPTKVPLAYDESGGLPNATRTTYRRSYWKWLLSGGGVVDNLDWTFAVGYETGTLPPHLCHETANGGADARASLQALSTFFHSLPFVSMAPNASWITPAVPAVLPPESVQALLLQAPRYPYVGFFAGGFVGVDGVESLDVHIRGGRCTSVIVEWIETKRVAPPFARRSVPPPAVAGQPRRMAVPKYEGDIAFRLSCEAK